MQDKFERKGKVVDAEMRSAFPLPPPLAELNDEQKLVVESCRYLESEEGGEWEPLPSSSPFVDMWCKHTLAKKGERSIALGKATAGESSAKSADLFLPPPPPLCSHMYVAVLDGSARDALASFFAAGAREDLRISSKQRDPARLVQRRAGSNDMIRATIKKMPFPLHNREFVARQVAATDTNGDLLFTSMPVDDVIDYGMSKRTVRGVSRVLLRLTPNGESQCKVTYHMYLDAGGRIPTFVVNAKLPLALGAVGDLREEFQRDDEIDKLKRDQLARVIKDEPQTYTAEEDILVNKMYVKLGMLDWALFEELESPDHFVKMGKIFVDGSSSAVVRASVSVDVSVEDCAVWEMIQINRERVKEGGALARSLTAINGHHGLFHLAFDLGIPGFQPREFLLSQVWRRQGEKLAVAYESVQHGDFPLNPSYVRGTTTLLWEYEKMLPIGGLPQTRVTRTQQVDLRGLIPKSIVNGLTVNQLMYLSTMRKRFDRSLEVDGATRARNVEMIMGHDGAEFSEEENRILAEGKKHFADFKEMKAKSVKMESSLTTSSIAYKGGDSHAWGWSTTTVRARPEEVLAFVWDTMGRSARREDDVEKSVEERVNGHNMLVYNKKRTPTSIADRDFLGRAVWKKEGDGFILVTSPEESEARPIKDGVVRGSYRSALRINRKGEMETTVEYALHPDAGGHLKGWLMNRYLGSILGKVTEIQEYFQALRVLEEWDAEDTRAVGEVMSIKTKAERHPENGENKQSARMRELFKKHLALSEIGRRYEFFEGMMARVVRNTLKSVGDVKSKLCCVSLKEGETIGKGLAMALASNLTAEAGVDEWILKHRSLGELDRTEAWFR